MFPIIHKRQLAESIYELGVAAPAIARAARAGQFLVLRVDEHGERIPLTFSDWSAEEGWIRFVFMVVGASTHKLSHLEAGDALPDVAGPLGLPSRVGGLGRVVIAAGGVGAAVAYPVARAMLAAGDDVTVILAARNAELLVLREEFESLGVKLLISTDDGSAGRHGLVTAPLAELAASGEIDHAMAIGPAIMMKFCAATCVERGVPVTVSLNPIMVDGTGMCGACRVTIAGVTKFACVDGPDFDGALVDFEELMNRQRVYTEEERLADAEYRHHHECGHGGFR